MYRVRASRSAAIFYLMITLAPPETSIAGQLAEHNDLSTKAAIKGFEILLLLGRDPQRISIEHIESEFGGIMKADFCDDQQWTCRWAAQPRTNIPSLTNLDLPNRTVRKYSYGGNMLMELPTSSCLSLDEISRRMQSRPIFPSAPPAIQAFPAKDEKLPSEQMAFFKNIPGVNPQVEITAWVYGMCLTRMELKALIKYED